MTDIAFLGMKHVLNMLSLTPDKLGNLPCSDLVCTSEQFKKIATHEKIDGTPTKIRGIRLYVMNDCVAALAKANELASDKTLAVVLVGPIEPTESADSA